MRVAILPLLFLACIFASVQCKCGYSSCAKTDPSLINVHVVPHTHDDVGWLKTVQQYYWGTNNSIQNVAVQNILDSVVAALDQNADRRFMYVETAFFWYWWTHRGESVHETVRKLVNEGRLELVSGGWSMNDEASVHYQSVIDQMTWGHRRLTDSLGKCAIPKIGWQIDPFGHSREQALLFTQMAFDGLFFGRAHYLDKEKRRNNHTMEMIWKTSDDLSSSDLLTGILHDAYGPPGGFNFDIFSGDRPIVDDPESEEYNVIERVDSIIRAAEERANVSNQSNIMLTFGNDFNFQDAFVYFNSLDKLVKYANERKSSGSKVNFLYSTPSCYVYNVHEEAKLYTSKSDDFFPYASDPHAFWTGYFTSRPAFKFYERKSNLLLQSCKSLQVFANLTSQVEDENVARLKEAMGITQHHDAVSGTEKEHVARDYSLQLSKGSSKCLSVVGKALNKLLSQSSQPLDDKVVQCPLLNASTCDISETNTCFAVSIHNPLAWSRKEQIIRLPWNDDDAKVIGPDGKLIISEIVPIPPGIISLPERKNSNSTNELLFSLDLPPASLTTVVVQRIPNLDSNQVTSEDLTEYMSKYGLWVKSKSQKIYFDSFGSIRFVILPDGSKVKVQQKFLWYRGMDGDNSKFEKRASGAYIFRPNGTANEFKHSHSLFSLRRHATVTRTRLFTQITQQINPWISQVVKVKEDSDLVELDYRIGPIPVEDKIGKEVISRFITDLDTEGTFYTDANGRQLLKRVRNNWGPTFDYVDSEPVAGNYYPVNSRILIRDVKRNVQVTIFNDRSQGGSSLEDGQLELMVHRRLLHDDAFGVGEAINEPGVDNRGLIIRGSHYLLVSSIDDSFVHRELAVRLHLPPVLYFIPWSGSIGEFIQSHRLRVSLLKDSLPSNVHLLTVENWKEGTLIRLEHIYQSSDETPSAAPVTIDLSGIFTQAIDSVSELTLSANQLLSQSTRFSWKVKDEKNPSNSWPSVKPLKGFNVTLEPMQIRTLLIKWAGA